MKRVEFVNELGPLEPKFLSVCFMHVLRLKSRPIKFHSIRQPIPSPAVPWIEVMGFLDPEMSPVMSMVLFLLYLYNFIAFNHFFPIISCFSWIVVFNWRFTIWSIPILGYSCWLRKQSVAAVLYMILFNSPNSSLSYHVCIYVLHLLILTVL